MPYQIGSGNKGTMVFADSGVIGRFRMIGEVAAEIGDNNVSALETEGWEEFEPQDLATMTDQELELYFDTKLNLLPATVPGSGSFLKLGHKELITSQFPERADESEGASLAAWGYFKKIGLPQMVNNTTMMLKATIKWCHRDTDGESVPPVYTKATAA